MRRLILTIAMMLLGASTVLAQNGHDLFQKALQKERAEGKLEEAIALYERIVEEHASDRLLAAKALFQMGNDYERLGRRGKAQQIFAMMAREYADQPALAEQARSKIINEGAEKGEDPGMIVRQVWTGPVTAMGSPSPDGRYLTYVDWFTGELALRDLEEEKSRDLTNKGTWADSNEYAEISVWAPDGRRVVYAWFNGSFYELRILEVDGEEPRILYSNPETDYLWPAAWSQDGQHVLALLVKPDKSSRIALIDVETGAIRELKSFDWRAPKKMSLSPDSRFVVYDAPVERDQPQHDIFLLATDGSREVPLVEHASMDYGPMWMPDGKHILFVSDRKGTQDLWALSMEGDQQQTAPRLIKQNVGAIRPVGFTKSGAYCYSLANSMRDVYVAPVNLKTGEVGPALPATHRFMGSNTQPAWSPDGRHLAFFSRRNEGGQPAVFLVVKDVDTSEERDLKLPLQVHPGMRAAWSRDGRFLYSVAQSARGRRGIYRVDARTGETTFITPIEGGAEVWPTVGEKLVYMHHDELYVHDLRTGQDHLLYRSHHLHSAALSPDGQYVAFSTADELSSSGEAKANVLKVISIAGGDSRELTRVDEEEEILSITWMPDGQALTYRHGSGIGSNELKTERKRISVEGGIPTPAPLTLPHPLGQIYYHTAYLHPAGDRLAYTFGKSTTEFWIMEDFLPDDEDTQ